MGTSMEDIEQNPKYLDDLIEGISEPWRPAFERIRGNRRGGRSFPGLF